MARPSKVGLDYFPLDIHVDDKIELLEAEHGLEGFAIIIKIFQKIYSSGYFIEWNEDTCMLFSRGINTAITKVNDVINTCLRRGLLDKELHEKFGILTSKGIQDRYFTVCKSARRKNMIVVKDYMLVVNTELTDFITEFIELSPTLSTQRKGKERKEDESKELDVFSPHTLKPENVSDDLWKEFLDNRKFKKLVNTELALTTITNAFKKGFDNGLSYDTMISEYVASGWKRFDYKWINSGEVSGNITDKRII